MWTALHWLSVVSSERLPALRCYQGTDLFLNLSIIFSPNILIKSLINLFWFICNKIIINHSFVLDCVTSKDWLNNVVQNPKLKTKFEYHSPSQTQHHLWHWCDVCSIHGCGRGVMHFGAPFSLRSPFCILLSSSPVFRNLFSPAAHPNLSKTHDGTPQNVASKKGVRNYTRPSI
jgi:hypothetical protein